MEAQKRLEETRAGDIRRHNEKGNVRLEPLEIGDLVLLHETRWEKSHDKKLSKKWSGPYRIVGVREDTSTYQLSELDITILRDYQAGSRLKLFKTRDEFEIPEPVADEMDIEWDDFEWVVKDVEGSREVDGKKQYKIRWAGYPRATWEPLENLDGCMELVKAYEERQKRKRAMITMMSVQ